MKLSVLFFTTLLALGLAGCESAAMSEAAQEANQEAINQGLPFRWQVKGGNMTRLMLPLPSVQTRADAALQHDILTRISQAEARENRGAAQLADVKRLRDGREIWLLQSAAREGIAYIVVMSPNTRGGVNIGLSEAITFVK